MTLSSSSPSLPVSPALYPEATITNSYLPAPGELDRLRAMIERAAWRFARTMPQNPHWYTLRATWADDADFRWAVQFIRDHGVPELFRRRKYIVLILDGYKFWTMGDPIRESLTDPANNTILINRKVYDPERS